MAKPPSSSPCNDEPDEERQTLFPWKNTKPLEIGHLPPRTDLRGAFVCSRWLCFLLSAIFLSLVLVLLLLFFRGVFMAPADSLLDQMRQSELRALHLLRDQQLGLLKIWNSALSASVGVASPPSSAPNPASAVINRTAVASFDELRSALFEQIELNDQIRTTLLSSHIVGNLSSEILDGNVDIGISGARKCKKVDRPASRRTIEWKPKKDRYLFAICTSGQMSNHLICLEKHMFFAALLDRTCAALLDRALILPSTLVDYQYDEVLDIGHMNECFGRNVVITFDDFSETHKNKMKIDRFICYMASPPCYIDEEHIKGLKNLGVVLGKIEAAWPGDAKLKVQKKRLEGDIMPKFTSDDDVIAIGDMFFADVEEDWLKQPGGPLAHKCKTVIQPNRLIYITAQRFVQTFLGSNFIALHFRRHGFLKFCNLKEESCFFPIPQAADCILRVVEKANVPVIYLSTDAAASETNLLQSLVISNDKPVPLVVRPAHDSSEKWDALLYRNELGGNRQVEAMLDKTICALSSVFIGTSGSTFTDDIIRLRRGWGSASECDQYLCQRERPNFIAENE